MKWIISWVESFEGEKGIIQADAETEPLKAVALVTSLLADASVSQITVLIEDANGRMES